MNKYKIQYLGQGRTIEIVEARCPKESIRNIIKLCYFTATKIKE